LERRPFLIPREVIYYSQNFCVALALSDFESPIGVICTKMRVLLALACVLTLAVQAQLIPGTRKQAFAFSAQNKIENWKALPWDLVSTVAIFGPVPDNAKRLVRIGHKHGSKVVLTGGYPVAGLQNETAKAAWIQSMIDSVKEVGADGVNLDTEDALPKGSPDALLLTELVKNLGDEMRKQIPERPMQISVDVAWSPDCIDVRCYDYLGLSKVSDYLFIMSYDTRSQIFSDVCTAGPNSAIGVVRHGVKRFIEIGVDPKKLILGLPWYGYNYPCLNNLDASGKPPAVCNIKEVPFRGVACSDAAGREHDFTVILSTWVNSSVDGLHYDYTSETPWFWYVDSDANKTLHQVWYDNPLSIAKKAAIAKDFGLIGTGMWTMDSIYGSPAAVDKDLIRQMWDSLCVFQTE
jgi:di-N-acetylchitobiase